MGKGVAHSPSAIDIRSTPWTLPAGSDEGDGPPPSPKDALHDTAAEPGKPRLLVVEDDYLIALDLTETVRRFGYEVCGVAATGANAIALAREQAPDLILMDVNLMGEMDGITAAERILATRAVPIIFVTAYGNREMVDRINRLHPADLLNKPVTPDHLRRSIERALARKDMN